MSTVPMEVYLDAVARERAILKMLLKDADPKVAKIFLLAKRDACDLSLKELKDEHGDKAI